MSKHPTPEQIAAFDARYTARRAEREQPPRGELVRFHDPSFTLSAAPRQAAPARTEAPPMTTPTRPLRSMTPAEIAAAGYHPYEIPAEKVNGSHAVFGRTPSGAYLVAMKPERRRELLEATETGREALAALAPAESAGTATFAATPRRSRMSAARRAELLGATAAGRQVLEEERQRGAGR